MYENISNIQTNVIKIFIKIQNYLKFQKTILYCYYFAPEEGVKY